MFDNLIDQYAERIRPLARDVGTRAEAYACQIVARLDLILAAVQSEEFTERRERLYANGNLDVPRGETWLLELVACADAGATITVVTAGGRTLWVRTFVDPNTVDGFGLILPGGASYAVASSVGAFYMQLRARRVVTGRRVPSAFPGADVTPNGSGNVVLPGGRHAGVGVGSRPMGDAANSGISGP